ncbi:MAG: hypothetical protein E7193_06215 [Erysipelotrichaceae bacterium]|nr:hypothetical protein [Erysipelotrichaceae bacterium]
MLRTCTIDEFNRYADFAYELATDLTKSGYPTYCDGVKTREMFMERSLKAFERETEEILLFEIDGKVEGLIHPYWIPEDHYLDTCLLLTNRETEQALSEFLEYAGKNFSGYDLFLGFPAENQAAISFLVRNGFECIENDYNNTSFLDTIEQMPENSDVTRITRENYDSFRYLHEQTDGDMYWNSDRIYDDLDNWVIFVKEKDGNPQGAVYYMNENDGWLEIFGIDIDQNRHDPALFRELLQAALMDAKRNDGRVMTIFCDEEDEDAARECGLNCVGNYLCHKKHLD